MVSSKEGAQGKLPLLTAQLPPPPQTDPTSPQDIANNYNFEIYPPLTVAVIRELPPQDDETPVTTKYGILNGIWNGYGMMSRAQLR